MRASSDVASPVRPPDQWISRKGQAKGLEGLSGKVRLQVADRPAGVLNIEDGEVSIGPDEPVEALVAVDTAATLVQVLGGELHPIVAWLQGRLRVEGDRPLLLRALLGLQAGSPWSGLLPKG